MTEQMTITVIQVDWKIIDTASLETHKKNMPMFM